MHKNPWRAGEEVEHVGRPHRIDTTNGHMDCFPRLPALVQSFLGIFFFYEGIFYGVEAGTVAVVNPL